MTKFKKHTRVVFLADAYAGPSKGTLGTVVKATDKDGLTLVAIDGFTEGHDGDCNYNQTVCNRWFVFSDIIEKAPKAPKPKATNTKIAKLRSHFLSGRSLTQLEAIGLYGAFRLAARVHDLKADGMKIVTRMKEDPNGNPYAEYQLRSPWVKG